jgi:dolichol kinase
LSEEEKDLSLKLELQRKMIHYTGGLSYLIAYFLLRDVFEVSDVRKWMIFLVGLALVGFLTFDYLRLTGRLPTKYFEKFERESEKHDLTAPSYFAMAALILFFLFDTFAVCMAVLVTTFGDGMAALAGKKYGKHRIVGKKTLEGTLTFFAVAYVILLLGYHDPEIAVVAAIAAIVELYPGPINDNFTITMVTGIALYAFGAGFGTDWATLWNAE